MRRIILKKAASVVEAKTAFLLANTSVVSVFCSSTAAKTRRAPEQPRTFSAHIDDQNAA